ncbi:acyltransferase [Gryllotalpicola daejeonensis]|uniref:Acyltransferase n=1 Tax=Gryllotalpicola daejeonensis TaxID=993087 RepID=A0ABP7ZE97_9MICO
MTEATEPTAEPKSTPVRKRRHIHEIDVIRILTFASVIGVHTISHTVAADDVPLHVLLGLLHFTREPFFWITGFVLMWSYFHKPVPMRKFWPRRFLLVGVPYLVWSLAYMLIYDYPRTHHDPSVGGFVLDYVRVVLTGDAWYHLYFLLVTMQVYLLVPVIAWLVRRGLRAQLTILGVAAVVQLALMSWYHYWPQVLPGFVHYDAQYFFSYSFFILAGAVCADHGEGFLGWIARNRGKVGLITLACAVFYLIVFAVQHAAGASLYSAGSPVQPAIVVWGVGVGLGFTALGRIWSDRRREGSLLARSVDTATDRSFGIFLSHPLILWTLLWLGDGWFARTLPDPWRSLVAYVVVVLGAIGLTELLRRSPASLWFTGRPRRRRPREAAPAAASSP